MMCSYNVCTSSLLELPTMLKISVEGNNVTIYPLPLPNKGIFYQSSTNIGIEIGAIFLEEAGPFNLTFLCMMRNASFIIGGGTHFKLN